jgi:hypothetical protein
MTIAELYARTVEDLAELERARLRLLGRADALAELCDAGLGGAEAPSRSDEPGGLLAQDAEEPPCDPHQQAVSRGLDLRP